MAARVISNIQPGLPHAEKLKRDNGKLFVVMKDGAEIPVSRPNADAVKARFAHL